MDIFEIRHDNLGRLIGELVRKGVSKRVDQAQQLGGLGSSYLSQLIAGKKMGEETARKIEEAMRLPRGWLDSSQTEAAPSQPVGQQKAIVAASLRLATYVREIALDPIPDERFEELLFEAMQVVSQWGAAGILEGSQMRAAAKEVSARIRGR